MKKLTNYILAIVFLFLCSCKKETSFNQAVSTGENALASEATPIKWQGAFLSYNGKPASSFVPDKLFIKNGYARIYKDSVNLNKENYYSTRFRLVLPAFIKIKGDSINFEAGLKNPLNSSYYNAFYGRDITLYIKGETNEASITNVATGDIDPEGAERAGIKFGQSFKNSLPQLQHNFEDYDTLILQTFNRGVVAYRNDTYLSGLGYEEEPVIGRLKEIGIVFKGSGYIDYIKVYNSANGKLLFSEDFNTDRQSNIMIAE
jgi:hypothetical protein